MSRIHGTAQSRWLADAREEIAAALRTQDDAWLLDMSMRWGCRLAMVIADFAVRVMLHEDGFVMKVEPASDAALPPPDSALDYDDGLDPLTRAAWIKLVKIEEYAIAALEAREHVKGNRNGNGNGHCDARGETLLAWREMLYAANEWPRDEADAYLSHACRPLLKRLMELASCATGGHPFELARDGDYEDAWREFDNFCSNARARPMTDWGRKYRNRAGNTAEPTATFDSIDARARSRLLIDGAAASRATSRP